MTDDELAAIEAAYPEAWRTKDVCDFEVEIESLLKECKRARRKEQQYRAMLQIAAPAVVDILDAEPEP